MILIQLKEAAKFLKTSQNIRAVKCQNLIVDLSKKKDSTIKFLATSLLSHEFFEQMKIYIMIIKYIISV